MTQTEPGTFAVAVKALIVKGGRVLLLTRSSSAGSDELATGRQFDLPGGRVEFGEAPEAALAREILEEVSLAVDVVAPLATWHVVAGTLQLVGITYLCRYRDGEVRLSREHDAFVWAGEEDLARLVPQDEPLYRRALAGL